MAAMENRDQRLKNQYKDATNFNARVALHYRFSVNKYRWHHWVFDQFELADGSKLLELGCGPGYLWQSNLRRIPASWHIFLTDFSSGMLQVARQKLGEDRFSYAVADAQELPFAAESFDAVIANHMLYHVPDLPRALAEIRRVLRPGGRFYATTANRSHMSELHTLLFDARVRTHRGNFWESARFTLDNGREVIAPFFQRVTLHIHQDALEVTEAEPLVAYILSSESGETVSSEERESLHKLIARSLVDRGGMLRITKTMGMFAASKG